MPGITFVYSPLPGEGFSEQELAKALGPALHPGYKRESMLDGSGVRVEVTRYPEYPLQRVEEKEFEGVVEGRLLSDKGAVAPVLRAVWEAVKRGARQAAIEGALSSLHGDFLVVLRGREDGRFILFNDRLARLPTYYFQDGPRLILSREPSVVVGLGKRRSLDAAGTTDFLVFGHPLGARTLLSGVRRLSPASWMTGGAGRSLSLHRAPERDFSERSRSGLALEKNATDLSELLVAASRDQAGSNNVLSLSGGLDSRAIGAALNRAGVPFVATTYSDAEGRAERDFAVAAKLAQVLGTDWHPCHLRPPTGSDYMDLLSFRYGANNLRMAFILPFFRWIRGELGADAVQFTGDGGLVMKPALPPKKRLADTAAVVDYLVNRYSFISLSEASKLTGQPYQHLHDRLVARVEEYPERDPVDRVAHFRIYDHAVNCNFEGEDRNRYYFWSCAPLLDWRFFVEAMACSEGQKAYHRLYAAVLTHLDVAVADMPRAEFGGAITRRRYDFLRRVEAYLGLMPNIERVVQRLRRRRRASPARPEQWKLQAIRSKALDGVGGSLWDDRLVPWLDARGHALNRNQVETLLTVVSLAELVERGTTSFEEALPTARGWVSE